jgi:hypothetical protein
MNRSKQAGMGIKTIIVVWLVGLAFAPFCPVEAQHTKKIPRIGFVSGSGDPQTPGFQVDAFRQGEYSALEIHRYEPGFA